MPLAHSGIGKIKLMLINQKASKEHSFFILFSFFLPAQWEFFPQIFPFHPRDPNFCHIWSCSRDICALRLCLRWKMIHFDTWAFFEENYPLCIIKMKTNGQKLLVMYQGRFGNTHTHLFIFKLTFFFFTIFQHGKSSFFNISL